MANKKFGDTLRELRNQKGYTQQQVADLLGLKNKSTLGSWEVGKSEPDGYTLLRLCKIYDVKDIYRAFGELSPVQYTDDACWEPMEKYRLLNSGYQRIVSTLISQLLELQELQERDR